MDRIDRVVQGDAEVRAAGIMRLPKPDGKAQAAVVFKEEMPRSMRTAEGAKQKRQSPVQYRILPGADKRL